MTNRKLDMGRAWTQTTALIGFNRETISAVAGLFFFLPSFAGGVFIPDLPAPPAAGSSGADPEVALRALVEGVTALYAAHWPLMLLLTVVQFIGSMTLFALLSDRGNPTVGEALATGLKSFPSFIAAQLISAMGIAALLVFVPGAVGLIAPPAVAALVFLAVLVAAAWLFIRLSLTAPVIAIEGELNPLAALARSWRLTKGNSLRILLFLFLLVFTIGIIAALVSGTLGLILTAFGEPVASIGIDLVAAVINALIMVILLVVTVGIHRQLAGPSTAALVEDFE